MSRPETGTNELKIAFQTLGCKLNQYETDALAARFRDKGYTIVTPDDQADCYVINTCTVTNKGDRKSRNAIQRTIRVRDRTLPVVEPSIGSDAPDSALTEFNSSDKAMIVVTGCYAESAKETLTNDGRIVVVPNDAKQSIFELVDARLNGELIGPDELPRGLFDYGAQTQLFHTRAMIKIQDGCDNFCSFCIIPSVRGRAVSRPRHAVLEELRELVDRGFREIVLTGVNISRYDDNDVGFSSLVEDMLEVDGDFRLRISSLEPDRINEHFLDLFGHPKMAPHLHLCLQSGSERILLQMRRQYTASEYRQIAENLLTRYPDFNLTTDCIVGFPGETDDDFQATCDMIESVGFSHVHTFPYSRRAGTRAERMPAQVPDAIKKKRGKIVRDLGYDGKLRYRAKMAGKTQRLLVEQIRDGYAHGYTEHYVPVAVKVPDPEHSGELRNQFVQVRLDPFCVPKQRNPESDLRMSATPVDRFNPVY